MDIRGEKPEPGFTLEELQGLLFPEVCDDGDLMTVVEITDLMRQHMPEITAAMVDYRLGKAVSAGKIERHKVRRIIDGRQRYPYGYRKIGGGKIIDGA
jgi:hypothetical protein